MGDRANVVMKFEKVEKGQTLGDVLKSGAIVLYTHWEGYYLGPMLANALTHARGRWSDDGYCARIIVSRMAMGAHEMETGFGLYLNRLGDNERPVLVLDIESQEVIRFGDGYLSPDRADAATETGRWSFHDFESLDNQQAQRAHLGKDFDQ